MRRSHAWTLTRFWLCMAALAICAALRAQSGGGFDLTWNTVSCGTTAASEAAGFELRSTMGQPLAGNVVHSGSLSLADGYGVIYAVHAFTVRLSLGWNLVSIPLIPLQPGFADILPEKAPGPVWALGDGQYDPRLEMDPMEGYWVWASGPGERVVQGIMVENPQRAVTPGWHLIGATGLPPYPALSLPLETVPAGVVTEPPWEWRIGLQATCRVFAALESGAGYLLYTPEAAILDLGP